MNFLWNFLMPPRLHPPRLPLVWIPFHPDATSLNPQAIPAFLKHPPCFLSRLCWSPELTSFRRTFPIPSDAAKGTGAVLIPVL